MPVAKLLTIATMLLLPLAGTLRAAEYVFEEGEPPVTDRVARISFIRGDVQVKRSVSDIWEKAVLNLPVVEGDEIATGEDSRIEIQFETSKYLRVHENAFVKITNLQDNGTAVSVSEGSVLLTLSKFNVDDEFFEIDAPRTTVAVQKAGRYRVDAGKANDEDVRVSIGDDGEARVYSAGSGFTLRNGRSAKVYVSGNLAGEFDTGDTSQYLDEFDTWAMDRDSFIARRLRTAHYGQYYDQDIYGADELNEHGQWLHTPDYGYIWRPYPTSINIYNDWSPYRYGHWRWLPAFGWTWVNDEPWGWATYHHGRWIWYRGAWHWSPYSYYRHRRSWWYPALVVLRVINRNVCWYPLSYHHAYYNYNWNYYRSPHWSGRRPHQRPPSTPAQRPPLQIQEPLPEPPGETKIIAQQPPPTAVIAVPVDDFGSGKGSYSKLPRDVARGVIAKQPDPIDELPRLPIMRDIRGKLASTIQAEPPRRLPLEPTANTGAAKREPGEPLDRGLRDKIVLGNRPAVMPRIDEPRETKTPPPTGAVQRRIIPAPNPGEPQRPASKDEPRRPVAGEPQRGINQMPRREPPMRREEPPARKQEPRDEPPQRAIPREPVRRSDPPPVQKEPSRPSPPPASEPRSEPPRKSDPPAQKSEPSKPAETKGRSKDNR